MNEELNNRLEILGIRGIPEIEPGDDLPKIIYNAIVKDIGGLKDDDIVIVTSKIISKAEGRYVNLELVKPSDFSLQISKITKKDPREVEAILNESKNIIKIRRGIIIVENKHGVICANAGIDKSNIAGDRYALLLPKDPDRSAKNIRQKVELLSGKRVAVLITDTYSRAWRDGHVNFAIGVSGIGVYRDYRGKTDHFGKTLRVTNIAQADELAAASELVMGKSKMVPVVIIRNYRHEVKDERAIKLNRPIGRDLFR